MQDRVNLPVSMLIGTEWARNGPLARILKITSVSAGLSPECYSGTFAGPRVYEACCTPGEPTEGRKSPVWGEAGVPQKQCNALYSL